MKTLGDLKDLADTEPGCGRDLLQTKWLERVDEQHHGDRAGPARKDALDTLRIFICHCGPNDIHVDVLASQRTLICIRTSNSSSVVYGSPARFEADF